MKLDVYQVDSFTTTPFQGNPAGVVLDAGGLSELQMRRIARELNNSETAFVIERPGEGYDVEVRFFTPTREVPICGHATIAAHYVYAQVKGIARGTVVQKTKAGILPVEIFDDGEDRRVVMTQAAIEFGAMIEGAARERLLEGLRIDDSVIDGRCPIQIVSTGHSKVLVPIRTKRALDAMRIDEAKLSDLSESIGCNGYYAFTFDSGEEGILVSGRMFAPAIGIREDPVTGNANGPLGAYLTRYGIIEGRSEGYAFRIKQGEAIDRKGYVDVYVYSDETGPRLVKIGGRACIAFKTELEIPQSP